MSFIGYYYTVLLAERKALLPEDQEGGQMASPTGVPPAFPRPTGRVALIIPYADELINLVALTGFEPTASGCFVDNQRSPN